VSFWHWRREIACRRAVELMSDYLDGRLDRGDRDRLEHHLGDCPDCVEYLAQLRVTIDTLGHAVPDDLSPAAVDELVELYQRWRA
jgi:anti-sigma factor RsiW